MACVRTALMGALCISGSALLAGCDNGPSAVSQQAAGTQMASSTVEAAPAARPQGERGREAVALVDGKPMWSASRRYSAQENARRAFERNGADFGADSVDEFVRKAHAFVERPPKGSESLTRGNGDLLLYDPEGNVFAVVSKEGAPRTMFKPDEGAAYWQEQKDREAKRQTAAARRPGRDDDA